MTSTTLSVIESRKVNQTTHTSKEKLNRNWLAGILLLVSGFGLFLFGAGVFVYKSVAFMPWENELGLYALVLCPAVMMSGILLWLVYPMRDKLKK